MVETTEFTRRVDDLGRIAIPKEIREKLDIQEGDGLEAFIDEDMVVFKKKSTTSIPFYMIQQYNDQTCNPIESYYNNYINAQKAFQKIIDYVDGEEIEYNLICSPKGHLLSWADDHGILNFVLFSEITEDNFED